MSLKKLLLGAAAAIAFSFTGAGGPLLTITEAVAEDCNRGTLDEAYCDRNFDQTADLPLDPKDWVNPDTIIFTYTPVEDPAVYASIWDGFVKHMEKVTGKKVVFLRGCRSKNYTQKWVLWSRKIPH